MTIVPLCTLALGICAGFCWGAVAPLRWREIGIFVGIGVALAVCAVLVAHWMGVLL